MDAQSKTLEREKKTSRSPVLLIGHRLVSGYSTPGLKIKSLKIKLICIDIWTDGPEIP